MPRLRNVDDQVIDVDDADVPYYAARGWSLDTADRAYSAFSDDAAAPRDTGLVGQAVAGLSSAASGATLGLSDVAFGSFATENQIGALKEARADNQITSTLGMIAGAALPAFATAGSSTAASVLAGTPAGAVSRLSSQAVAAAGARGGIAGTAGKLAAFGAEGAAQNVGSYFADVALGDRKLSAEAVAAAAGSGFKWGAATGGVALGAEKGLMSARRLFARTAEGGEQAAQQATAAWEKARAEAIGAHEEAANAARAKLESARAAREAAAVEKQRITARIAEEKAALAREVPDEAVGLPTFEELYSGRGAGSSNERLLPYSELAERGWNETAGVNPSDGLVAAIKKDIAAGGTPHVIASMTRNGDVFVGDMASMAALRAARETGKPVRVSLQRMDYADIAMKWGDGSDAFVRRGLAAEAEEAALSSARARIAAREIPDELGPFTPEGLEAAAKRVVAREQLSQQAEARIAEAADEFAVAKQALDGIRDDITSGRVEGELGPFTPAGLEAAVQREAGRRAAAKQQRMSTRQIETLHDEAIDRAAQASDPVVKQAEIDRAMELRKQLVEQKRTIVDEVADGAQLMTRYEEAAAKLADALGPDAPPAARKLADDFRAAQGVVDRKLVDKTARDVDDAFDAAERSAKAKVPSAKERLAEAQKAATDIDIDIAKARAAEAEAAALNRQAQSAAGKARKEFGAANPRPVVDTGGDGDIPLVSSIPVVGPLLSLWMKAKTTAAMSGRFAGKIPDTPWARVAAKAATIKNKVAGAVDKALGIGEVTARGAQKVLPRAAVTAAHEALSKRAFDDGEPDAKPGADVRELAAVRIREVAFAATNPQEVIRMVRREMRGVDDPDVIAAAEEHQVNKYQYLNEIAPKSPPPNPYADHGWQPSSALAMKFARALETADNPVAAFEALSQQCLAPEQADTLRRVYPQLYEMARQRLISRAADIEHPVPYQQRLRNSLLFDVPLDASLEPDGLLLLQSAHAATGPNAPQQPAPNGLEPGAPPVPTIAANVNLMSLYQTGADRRSQR